MALPTLALVLGCGDNRGAASDPVPDGGRRDAGTLDAALDAPVDAPDRDPLINEFVLNLEGSDTHEYVEVFGNPDSDFSHLTILQIEASPFQDPGRVDVAVGFSTSGPTGHAVTEFQNAVFQNTSMTLLLVDGFTGGVGMDIDADNDGVIDNELWSAIADAVAIDDGAGVENNPDVFYADLVMPPTGMTALGGASRIPDGQNTGSAGDWVENDLGGSGLPCAPCAGAEAASGEANNTPGAPNSVEP